MLFHSTQSAKQMSMDRTTSMLPIYQLQCEPRRNITTDYSCDPGVPPPFSDPPDNHIRRPHPSTRRLQRLSLHGSRSTADPAMPIGPNFPQRQRSPCRSNFRVRTGISGGSCGNTIFPKALHFHIYFPALHSTERPLELKACLINA